MKWDQNSLLENSLFAMIGVAYYMGFRKIYLVGMDYLLDRPISGHFYENYQVCNFDQDNIKNNKNFFDNFDKDIEFTLIRPNKSNCENLNSVSYSDFFLTNEKNNLNTDIISGEDLKDLNKTNMLYKIF